MSSGADFPVVQIYDFRRKAMTMIPYKSIAGLTAQQILEHLVKDLQLGCISSDLCLRLKTDNGCSLRLQNDLIPFRLCKDLIIIRRDPDDGASAKYHLHVSKPKDLANIPVFQFVIPVVDGEGKFLYNASISMNSGAYKIHVITRFLRKVHCCDSSMFQVYNEMGDLLDGTMSGFDFVKKLIYGRMYVSFTPTPQQLKTMNWRVAAMQEIIATEEKYVETLSGFRENVGGVLFRGKFLSKDDMSELLSASDIILNIHTQMLADMKKLKIHFMTQIGDLFCKYVPFFKVYHQYAGAYKRLLPSIVKAMSSSNYNALFQEFARGEYANGLAFDSVLIIPVQRGPRYSLLIRETLKHTPKAHPDYTKLSVALEKSQEVLQQVDVEISMVERRQRMAQLESMFEEKVSLIEPQRVFIETYKVYSRSKFMFILFSDEFWIASINNFEKLTLSSRYPYIDINCIKYGKQSVVIRAKTDKVFSFFDLQQRDSFFKTFREVATAYQNEMRDQTRLEWELQPLSKNIELSDHGMVFCCGSLWIFGGRDGRSLPKGDVRKIEPGDKMIYLKEHDPETDPSPRYSTAMCASQNEFYIFGGTDGTSIFDDFWCFDCVSTGWRQIKAKGVRPVAGAGLDLAFFGDRLVLTGGTDCFRAYQYIIDKNEWILGTQEGIILPSLTDHCVIPIPHMKGSGLAVGGKFSDGKDNNLIFLLPKYGQSVTPILTGSLSPADRVGHKCCLIDDTIYVYGGEDETSVFALCLLTHTWSIPNCSGLRKIPQLTGHAMTAANGRIFIHGGRSPSGDVESAMYQVTPIQPGSKDDISFMTGTIVFEKDDFVWNMLKHPTSVRDDIPTGDVTDEILTKTRNIMAMTNMKRKK